MSLAKLVQELVDAVLVWDDELQKGRTGPKHQRAAARVFDRWEQLKRDHGDEGRKALLPLFRHPRQAVRVAAASFLLRFRHRQAAAQLRKEDTFTADQVLKQWARGEWALDGRPPARKRVRKAPRPPGLDAALSRLARSVRRAGIPLD